MFELLQDLFPTHSVSLLRQAVNHLKQQHPEINDDSSLVDRVADFLLSASPEDLDALENVIHLEETSNDAIQTIDLSADIQHNSNEQPLKRSSEQLVDLTENESRKHAKISHGSSKKNTTVTHASIKSSSSTTMHTDEGVKMLEELFPEADRSFLQQTFVKARLHDKENPVNYASSLIFDMNNSFPKKTKQKRASAVTETNAKSVMTIDQYKTVDGERGKKLSKNSLYQICSSQVLLMAFPSVPRTYIKSCLLLSHCLFTPTFFHLDNLYRNQTTTPLPFAENIHLRKTLAPHTPADTHTDLENIWFEDDSEDKNFDFSCIPPKPTPVPMTHQLPMTTTDPIYNALKLLNIMAVDADFNDELLVLQASLRQEHTEYASNLRRHYLYKHAVKAGTILQCGCCFGDTIAEEASQCTDAHLFCIDCIQRAADVLCGSGRIEVGWSKDENQVTNSKGKRKMSDPPVRWIMRCIWSEEDGCNYGFTEQTLRKVVKADVLNGYLRRMQEDEIRSAIFGESSCETSVTNPTISVIAGEEQDKYKYDQSNAYFCFVSCPFCDYGAIMERPPAEDKLFICLNPACGVQTCRFCGRENHVPLTCKEASREDILSLRHKMEEAMTDALLRDCWKCKKKFFKTEGCNKMTCVCGALMCYICRQPVQDYSHFSDINSASKCPLFDDTAKRNAEDALKGAKAVEEAIREELVERGFAPNDLANEQHALVKELQMKVAEQK